MTTRRLSLLAPVYIANAVLMGMWIGGVVDLPRWAIWSCFVYLVVRPALEIEWKRSL